MISVPPKGDAAKRIGAHFTPLQVDAHANPDMTVSIQPGSFYTALGEHMEFAGGNTPTISPPSSQAKWVVVALNENANIEIIDGVASGDPVLPAIPETNLPLAAIFVGDTATVITTDMVFDIRPLWQIRPENIPNLQNELDDRPTTVDVNALLAAKADMVGTDEPTFTLNQDHVGVPGSDAEIIVERGANPNVSIRWNESANEWQFSNDGSTWDAIGASTGTFYTQAALNGGALNFLYYTEAELDGGALDTRYYTETETDAIFALIAHPHVAADITDFVTEVAANVPVQNVAGKTGIVTLVEADITDLDKYDTVPGAVATNVVQFGAGNTLADSGVAVTSLSLNGHLHIAADVTDFDAAADARIAAAIVDDLADVVSVAPTDGHVLAYSTSSGWYVNRFLVVDELDDVVNSSPITRHVLVHNGVAYVNRLLEKDDISDFVEGDFVHTYDGVGSPIPSEDIYGAKTFHADVSINGSLSIDGAAAALLTNELRVEDKFFDINWGETGAGVGGVTPQDAGMRVKRGSEPDALMYWDESSDQWIAGVVGSANPIVTGAHSHPWVEVFDFGPGVTVQLGVNNLNTIQDVVYSPAPLAGDYLRHDGATWVNAIPVVADVSDFGTGVTAELNVNNLDEIQDVNYPAPPVNTEALLYNAGMWENRAIVKSDVSDFVESDYIHSFLGVGSPIPTETAHGDKTFTGNITIGGDTVIGGSLTVNGTNNVINTMTLTIEDNIIEVNKGETGAGVGGGAGNAGMQVDRGSLPNDALLVWDELNQQWEAGVSGTMAGISLQGHLHVMIDITDVTATATEINQLNGVTSPIQAQIDSKVSKSGDTMIGLANLSFSGGEVLGLPATPTVNDAAASKLYVDTEVGTVNGALTTHVGDATVHLTLAQNTLLDALSPTLTAAHLNFVEGVTSAIQTQIDGKAALAVPSAAGNLAALTVLGDLQDSGLVLNDSGAAATDLWSASKITTELGNKADKVGGATVGNFAGLDGSGNLTDSGSSASTFAAAVHVHDAADLTTGTLADARVAVSNVTQHVASIDHDQLLNYVVGQHRVINDVSTSTTDLWSASKIDTTKADKVGGATLGNFAGLDATGNITDSGSNAATFAAAVHTHIAADVTDFSSAADARIAAAVIDDLADVTSAGHAAGQFLMSNGAVFASHTLDKSDVSDFVESDYVHTTGVEAISGDKTFNDDVIVSGDLTVNGALVSVTSSQVEIGDSILTLNADETGAPSVDAGLEIERGTLTNSRLLWDEVNDIWKAGIVGSEEVIARETVTVAQPDYEIQLAGVTQTTFTTSITVPVPAAGKTAVQVFVNGIKQIEGAGKHYTISSHAPVTINFTATNEPPTGADVEVYGFGTIG